MDDDHAPLMDDDHAPLKPINVNKSASTSGSGSGSDDNADKSSSGSAATSPTFGSPHKPLAVLSDHAGSVSCLALCGEFVLSASHGRDILVWQQPDLRLFARFGHPDNGSVKSLVVVRGLVFSAHQDCRIRVWKVKASSSSAESSNAAFKLVATLPTRKDYLLRFMKQSNYVQTRRNHRRLWIQHADSISSLAASADGDLVYSASWDKTLKVWRVSDLRCLESVKAHDDAINSLAASNGLVYSASADGTIKAWGKDGDGSHSLKGCLEAGYKKKNSSAAAAAAWNAVVVCEEDGGRVVYGGGSDGRVVGWEVDWRSETWRLVCDVRAHEMAVLCLCVKGAFVCSGSADKTIGVWRREEGGEGRLRRVGVIRGHEGPVKCLQASDVGVGVGGGFMLYSGGLDKRLRVWWVPKDYGEEGNHSEEGSSTSGKLMEKCILLS